MYKSILLPLDLVNRETPVQGRSQRRLGWPKLSERESTL